MCLAYLVALKKTSYACELAGTKPQGPVKHSYSLPGAKVDSSEELFWEHQEVCCAGFPGGTASKESACSAGDLGSIPGLGRSPGEGIATRSSILAWETLGGD